jgi:magnesium-protoporphyrin O-methyltransferase
MERTGFFSKYARRYARRFKRRGPDRPSRKLIDGLRSQGIQGFSLLDIGCGVGGVHLTLLKGGALTAQAVEISAGMIEAAVGLSKEMKLDSRVEHVHGDFVGLNGGIRVADVVILDKVVCCYPDPELLLGKATARTKKLLAISYPGRRRISRIVFGGMHRLGQWLGWSFRPYYHEPAEIDRLIEGFGFTEQFADSTLIWQVKVWSKN